MESETECVLHKHGIVGFVQYGKPAFHTGTQGKKYYAPDIYVIRHLYFDSCYPRSGEALLESALRHAGSSKTVYAFYHALGMSRNAYHGKLHESMPHVEHVLRQKGFTVEHENVYFALSLRDRPMCLCPGRDGYIEVRAQQSGEQRVRYAAFVDGSLIGSTEVRSLNKPDGDVAYLTWFGIEQSNRGKGLGKRFLHALECDMAGRGYAEMHTDTALET